eukprot:scaffold37722_cov26-Tisochrysis_lutea.AAC.2
MCGINCAICALGTCGSGGGMVMPSSALSAERSAPKVAPKEESTMGRSTSASASCWLRARMRRSPWRRVFKTRRSRRTRSSSSALGLVLVPPGFPRPMSSSNKLSANGVRSSSVRRGRRVSSRLVSSGDSSLSARVKKSRKTVSGVGSRRDSSREGSASEGEVPRRTSSARPSGRGIASESVVPSRDIGGAGKPLLCKCCKNLISSSNSCSRRSRRAVYMCNRQRWKGSGPMKEFHAAQL